MSSATTRSPMPTVPFLPKLVTVIREGYSLSDLRADAIAGLTVAIVALPLSMAIAIASGVTPDRGLYTAIVGGFCVSALGGSRFQIGGPAGAFIVLVSATAAAHGVEGLLLATMMAGIILLAVGFLRLGTFIRYIPYPVTVGFTAGIAVIITASQIHDLLGVTLSGPEPGPFLPKIMALAKALPTADPATVAVALASLAAILAVRRFRPHWPAYLIAVAVGAVLAWALGLSVATIGTKFGGIPRALPAPQFPDLSPARIVEMLPSALSFALLGGIESLLSAVVADSMSGRRHRSNVELMAQGVANIASALFGGICVTGTIARTATNVRAGARSPFSGMLHSALLLVFMLIAAPLASYIPLAALAAVLAVVAWNMAEKHAFGVLLRASTGDAVVVLVTFLLVVFRDLTQGIVAGFSIGALLFLHRMASSVEVQQAAADMVREERAEAADDEATGYDARLASDPDIVVFHISGAFFFGAAASVAAALDRMGEHPKAYVLDLGGVPVLDSTAAETIAAFVRKAARAGAAVYVASARPAVRKALLTHGVRRPQARFVHNVREAASAAHARIDPAESAAFHAAS